MSTEVIEISSQEQLNLPSSEAANPDQLPLRTPWTLYFSSATKNSSWEMTKVFEAKSVGDFMLYVNHTKLPSAFASTIELSLFRSGVTPDWEVEPCKSGGRWTVRVDKLADSQIDSTWLELLLSMVGESFVSELPGSLWDSVVGLAYSGKPGSAKKLSLWTSIRGQEEAMAVGNRFRDVLQGLLPDRDLGEIAFNDFTSGDKYAFTIGKKKLITRGNRQSHN